MKVVYARGGSVLCVNPGILLFILIATEVFGTFLPTTILMTIIVKVTWKQQISPRTLTTL